ncbi:MAG: Gx transporter family protein [Treponema sp.]|nr:Gx transporter family protein [Treponema sp.]
MQSRNKLAYLCALTLLFSYAEMILPRIIPFFRLGLANTVILLALELDPLSLILLSILKATAASLTAGTLFSPFYIISLLQSLLSALLMKVLYKVFSKKAISIYGISLAGSELSAFIQIFLAALYLGKGTYSLLGPMLIFNILSGLLTAFFCEKSGIKESLKNFDEISFQTAANFNAAAEEKATKNIKVKVPKILAAIFIITLSISLFFIKNLIVLAAALLLSLTAQKLSKRNIYILPHLSLWLFIFFSILFIPNGKVIFKIWNISLTQDALIMGIQKALTLSSVSALSQCAVSLKPGKETLLGQSLGYYKIMNDRFRTSKGSIIQRIKYSLCINLFEHIQENQNDKESL